MVLCCRLEDLVPFPISGIWSFVFLGREPSVMPAVVTFKAPVRLHCNPPYVSFSELCGQWGPDHADCAVVCSH